MRREIPEGARPQIALRRASPNIWRQVGACFRARAIHAGRPGFGAFRYELGCEATIPSMEPCCFLETDLPSWRPRPPIVGEFVSAPQGGA